MLLKQLDGARLLGDLKHLACQRQNENQHDHHGLQLADHGRPADGQVLQQVFLNQLLDVEAEPRRDRLQTHEARRLNVLQPQPTKGHVEGKRVEN